MEKGKYHIALEPNGIYHIFSRGEGSEVIFKCAENYLYFLQKLKEYSSDIGVMLAFSLRPNHFHLLVKIKNEEELMAVIKQRQPDETSKVLETFEVSSLSTSKKILNICFL